VLQILGKPTEEDITGMSNPKFYELLRAMDPREPVLCALWMHHIGYLYLSCGGKLSDWLIG